MLRLNLTKVVEWPLLQRKELRSCLTVRTPAIPLRAGFLNIGFDVWWHKINFSWFDNLECVGSTGLLVHVIPIQVGKVETVIECGEFQMGVGVCGPLPETVTEERQTLMKIADHLDPTCFSSQ